VIKVLDNYEKLLTVAEVCVILRACPAKVYRMLKQGIIPGFLNGGMWLIPENGIAEYIKNKLGK